MCMLICVAPIKEFPPGWPQLAAFHYSEENLAVFRRFGLTRCRLLVQLEAEIQQLETKLFKLDWSDAPDDAPNHYRLNMIDFEEGWDSAQVDLRRQLEKKFLVYGECIRPLVRSMLTRLIQISYFSTNRSFERSSQHPVTIILVFTIGYIDGNH